MVNNQTKWLYLAVHFPAERKFKRARLTEMYGGAEPRHLNDLENITGEGKAEFSLEDPKLGGSYELRWEW
jgi:hypothetical protein